MGDTAWRVMLESVSTWPEDKTSPTVVWLTQRRVSLHIYLQLDMKHREELRLWSKGSARGRV
jgi:hypothetical protein